MQALPKINALSSAELSHKVVPAKPLCEISSELASTDKQSESFREKRKLKLKKLKKKKRSISMLPLWGQENISLTG